MVPVMEPGDLEALRRDEAVPTEVGARPTARLEVPEIYELIAQSEGEDVARRLALGTPGDGMPQLADEAAAPRAVEPEPVPHPPAPQPSRLVDLAIGGTISLCAMIAWFVATQLL